MRAEEERDCHNRRFHKHYLLTRLLNRTPLTKLIQRREEAEFLYRYTRLILMEFEEDFFGREASDMKEFAGCFTDIFPKGYDFLDLNPMQAIFFLKDTKEDTGAVKAVSYTHLDVYKRQLIRGERRPGRESRERWFTPPAGI